VKSATLKKELEALGLFFDDIFYERCGKFTQLLQEWGRIHNLTSPKSLTDKEIETNIIDSLYPLKFLAPFDSCADIGTGCGYPGMILAIAKPMNKFYLIEPRVKRVAFLNFTKNILGLKNVEILQKRVENVQDDIKCELITSRAVTNTQLLLGITKNISSLDTSFLFYKGSICEDEITQDTPKDYEIITVGEHRNYLYIKQGVRDDI